MKREGEREGGEGGRGGEEFCMKNRLVTKRVLHLCRIDELIGQTLSYALYVSESCFSGT